MVNGSTFDGVLVILKRDWQTNRKLGVVLLTCPCCGVVSRYSNLAYFETYLRRTQDSIRLTTNCGCLKEQRVYLDDFEEAA